MVQQKRGKHEQARVHIESGDRRGRNFTWLFVGLILAIGIIGNVFEEDITGKTTFHGKGVRGVYGAYYQPTIAAEDIRGMGLVLYTTTTGAADVEEFVEEMADGIVIVEVGQLTRLGTKRFYGIKGPFQFDTENDDDMNDLMLITSQLASGGSTFKITISGQNYLVTPEGSY